MPRFSENLRFEATQLKNNAGLLGAVYYHLQQKVNLSHSKKIVFTTQEKIDIMDTNKASDFRFKGLAHKYHTGFYGLLLY